MFICRKVIRSDRFRNHHANGYAGESLGQRRDARLQSLRRRAAVLDLTEVGAFPSFASDGNPQIRFGLYLPGIQATDGFSVVVRIITLQTDSTPSSKRRMKI
jgi:hypothetical protein